MKLSCVLWASTFLSAAVLPANSLAQTTLPISSVDGSHARTENTYPASYFTVYGPRSANDMMGQVPGFEISERDNSRGLGQGGANVLINGARLTGKSSAREQLSRISAVNVVRIDIVDGATLNVPGLSGRVANIIIKTSGLSGVWEWEPQWRQYSGLNLARGSFAVSSERGTLGYTLNAQIDNRRDTDEGFGLYYDGDSQLLQNWGEDSREDQDDYTLGADLTWSRLNGHLATLTTQINYSEGEEVYISDKRRAAGAASTVILSEEERYLKNEDELNFQLGADYSFPFLFGDLKLITSWRDEYSEDVENNRVFENTVLDDERVVVQDQDEGERVFRSEFSWLSESGSDLQLSAEAAFNFLDRYRLTSQGTEDDRVEERRAEVTLAYGRTLTPKLDLQSSIGVEYSELTQSDALSATDDFVRDFVRPKGFITLAYTLNDSLTLRSQVERQVGQLAFRDFLSSANLQTGVDTQSNPDLVPQQSWLTNIELDKEFGQGNRLSAKVYHTWVEDAIDRLIIQSDDNGTITYSEAVGNLEDVARRWGIEFVGSIRGERWGYDGMQAEFELALRDGTLKDPLTQNERPFNNSQKYNWSVDLRHDILNTNWAYGFTASQIQNYRTFRLNTEEYRTDTHPRTSLYIENKDVMGVTVEARLFNLLDEANVIERTQYEARRGFSDIQDREYTELEGGPFFRVSLSGTF